MRYWVHSNYLILAEYPKNYFNLITRFFKKDNSKQNAKLQDSGDIHQKNQTLKKNFFNYDQSILPIMINKQYVVNKESQISEYNIWLRWDIAIRKKVLATIAVSNILIGQRSVLNQELKSLIYKMWDSDDLRSTFVIRCF